MIKDYRCFVIGHPIQYNNPLSKATLDCEYFKNLPAL